MYREIFTPQSVTWMTFSNVQQTKSRRAVSGTWAPSGILVPIPLPLLWPGRPCLIPCPGQRQRKTPRSNTHRNVAFSRKNAVWPLQSPRSVSSRAHVAQASTKLGLCSHCCRHLLAHPVPPPSPVVFPPQQIPTSSGAPCILSLLPRHLFCVGSQGPVKCLHNAAGFADVNKVACMWVFWPWKGA